MLRIQPFYDGDLNLVKRMYITIFSFLRKFTISYKEFQKNPKLDNQTNINGMIIEPIGP